MTQIGDGCFCDCLRLQSVTFEEESQLQIIGKETFKATSIKDIVIPDEVSEICEAAFKECTSLESVKIGANSKLVSIGKESFFNTYIES